MKTYERKARQFGYQLAIPDDWSASGIVDALAPLLDRTRRMRGASRKMSDQRTLLGPQGRFLHILATPLADADPEPSIDDTRVFFDGLARRQSLKLLASGQIPAGGVDHFWAIYVAPAERDKPVIRIYKKYCLYLQRVEYLLTAELFALPEDARLPTRQMLDERAEAYDEIVRTFSPLAG